MGIPPSLAKNMFVQEYFVFVKITKQHKVKIHTIQIITQAVNNGLG